MLNKRVDPRPLSRCFHTQPTPKKSARDLRQKKIRDLCFFPHVTYAFLVLELHYNGVQKFQGKCATERMLLPCILVRLINFTALDKSIAFGKAPRREADSQPIRQAVSQAGSWASRQADRQAEIQFGFFGGSLQLQTVGNLRPVGTVSGRVVEHSRNNWPFVSSNPGPAIADWTISSV